MSFSERNGYKPAREVMQIESMDEGLRNGLWSLLKVCCWDDVRSSSWGTHISEESNKDHFDLVRKLWFSYFKKPLDTLDSDWSSVLRELRLHFFGCTWNEVYDFIEFVAKNFDQYKFDKEFPKACNDLLEREMSAYRFVGTQITRITDEQEIAEIDEALSISSDVIRTHLNRALELMSDKKSPDYRNSIKESISAVESLVALRVESESGTLGAMLNRMQDRYSLHPALKDAFKKLYGYTSDENGIRHSLMEVNTNDFHDAKLMLLLCSSFINYVIGKTASER